MRNFQHSGRSNVLGNRGAIATSHPVASHVGLTILHQGGSAVDACIAATAVLGIAEPAMTGIGGDCFAMLASPGQRPIAINGSGFSPANATYDAAKNAGPTRLIWKRLKPYRPAISLCIRTLCTYVVSTSKV